jgi:transcriptional regulator with XRE-family HTH domain
MNPRPSRSQQKRLKKILIDRDLELEDLPARTGLSLSLIKKIASGAHPITARTAARIENFLGARIFSTPKQYRDRCRRQAANCTIEFDEPPANPPSATQII